MRSSLYLNKYAFKHTSTDNRRSDFNYEVSQFVALTLCLNAVVLATDVKVFEFEEDDIEERISNKTRACVKDGERAGWLL